MKNFNKGSALLQVLVLSALIATIVVVLLRFSITRTSNMVQTKNLVGAKLAVQACMTALNDEEINRIANGLPPYFDATDDAPFVCSYNNYAISITRNDYTNDTTADHKPGVVRKLDFNITFYNSDIVGDGVEEEDDGEDDEEI